MKPFAVQVGDDVLDDLHRRLDATRWPDEAPDAVPSTASGSPRARARDLLARRLRLAGGRGDAERLRAVTVDGVHFLAEGDGPPLLLLHGWPSSVWEFTPHAAAAARARAGDRPLAARLRLLVRARRQRAGDRGLRRRAARADALARPRALPRGGRRLGREHRRPARPRLPRRRAGAAPVHDAAAPARDRGRSPRAQARAALAHWQRGGGRLRAHPGHAAADARLRPAGLAGRADELDRREVRPLDRRARRHARRRADDGDDLLGDRLHRLVVLALLGAPARRLGARRRRRGGRADRRAADLPRLPEGARPRAARRSSSALFEIERWETPDYGGHFPALEATDVLADSLRRFMP